MPTVLVNYANAKKVIYFPAPIVLALMESKQVLYIALTNHVNENYH